MLKISLKDLGQNKLDSVSLRATVPHMQKPYNLPHTKKAIVLELELYNVIIIIWYGNIWDQKIPQIFTTDMNVPILNLPQPC